MPATSVEWLAAGFGDRNQTMERLYDVHAPFDRIPVGIYWPCGSHAREFFELSAQRSGGYCQPAAVVSKAFGVRCLGKGSLSDEALQLIQYNILHIFQSRVDLEDSKLIVIIK